MSQTRPTIKSHALAKQLLAHLDLDMVYDTGTPAGVHDISGFELRPTAIMLLRVHPNADTPGVTEADLTTRG